MIKKWCLNIGQKTTIIKIIFNAIRRMRQILFDIIKAFDKLNFNSMPTKDGGQAKVKATLSNLDIYVQLKFKYMLMTFVMYEQEDKVVGIFYRTDVSSTDRRITWWTGAMRMNSCQKDTLNLMYINIFLWGFHLILKRT